MTAASDSAGPKPGPAEPATLALVEELRAMVSDTLGLGIERMFDGADDMLFEMARRASNNKDQRVYFDAMRVVRLGRPKIGKIFRAEIARGFDGSARREQAAQAAELGYDNLTLQESKALEQSIAISAMSAKAENQHGDLLFELSRRLEWLIKEKRAPISSEALSPATLCDAFRRSAETLDVEFDVELVIFKLFDRQVMSELGELYTRAMAFLEQNGVKAAAIGGSTPRRRSASAPTPPSTDSTSDTAPAPPPGAAASYGFAQMPAIDATTLHALRNLGAMRGSAAAGGVVPPGYYADVQLGEELAMAASGQVVAGWDAPRAFAYVQRAGAVGQMFNELMLDPSLPGTLKPRFDQMRFAVIKSALKDSSFFTDHLHPVRGLLNELATLAASARTSGADAMGRIEELVGQIQAQFEVAAEEVRTQSALPGTIDEPTLEAFLARQKEDVRRRRQALIERTRQVVAEELQLRTLSRKVPDGTWLLLNSGWAPMASLRLLKQGADSEAWNAALDLLHRVLDSVDARQPESRAPDLVHELEDELDARLREMGMADERVYDLMRGWRDSVRALEDGVGGPTPSGLLSEDDSSVVLEEIPFQTDVAEPASVVAAPSAPAPAAEEPRAAAAPDPVALLDLLMVLSSWFRVYDHDRGQNRWLKVVGHHPDEGAMTFAEFNGQNKLRLASQLFLDDLVAGRAEPIDLGPAARRSLDAYLATRRDGGDTKAA